MRCAATVMTAAVLAASLALFSGCSAKPSFEERDYLCMDTVFSLKISRSGSTEEYDPASVADGCERLSDEIDCALSATKTDSDTSDFNKDVSAIIDADPYFIDAAKISLDLSAATDGAFDPTLGALTSLWNVKGGGPVPSDEAITEALTHTGTDKIEISDDSIRKSDTSLMLDFGAVGKGFAAQKLIEYIANAGADYGIVSAGRTVGVFGEKPDKKPFRIGIADPGDSDGVVGYVSITGGFVSVAGDYETYFVEDGVKYHHIMDPETGRPAESGLSSVAVLSQNGSAADALSTALFVMGKDRAMELYRSGTLRFEAMFISHDGMIDMTDGFADSFELSGDTYTIETTSK